MTEFEHFVCAIGDNGGKPWPRVASWLLRWALMSTIGVLLTGLLALAPLPLRAQDQTDMCAAATRDMNSSPILAAPEFDACAVILEHRENAEPINPNTALCLAYLSGGDAWAAAANDPKGDTRSQLDSLMRSEDDYTMTALCGNAIQTAGKSGYDSVRNKLRRLNLSEMHF